MPAKRTGIGFSFADAVAASGFSIPASASIPFANIAARNTWAAANLGDLVKDQTVVSVSGTPDDWYIWRGASNPDSHTAANWREFITPVSIPGPQGPGVDFTNLSAGAYARVNAAGDALESGSLEEKTDAIEASKMLDVPVADGVKIGAVRVVSTGLSAAAILPDGRQFTFVTNEKTDSTSNRPTWPMVGGPVDYASPADQSETFTGAQIQFKFVTPAFIPIQTVDTAIDFMEVVRVTFQSAAANPVTDCDIVVRLNSHTGPVLFDYKNLQGSGFTINAGSTQVDIPGAGFVSDAGVVLYITVAAGDGQTLSLSGQTITVDGTSETVPNLIRRVRPGQKYNLISAGPGEFSVLPSKETLEASDGFLGETAAGSKFFGSVGDLPFLSGITIQNAGVSLSERASTLNFIGATAAINNGVATVTVTASGGGGGLTEEQVRDTVAAFLTAGPNIGLLHNDAANTLQITGTDTNTQRTDEDIFNVFASAIQAGTNTTIVRDDDNNTVTINASVGIQGLSVTNKTGSALEAGRPVVVDIASDGTLQARAATTALIDAPNVASLTAQKRKISGFAPSAVANDATFTLVTEGTISDVSFPALVLGTTGDVGDPVGLERNGANYLLSTAPDFDTLAVANSFGYVGYIKAQGTSSTLFDIHVDLGLVERSNLLKMLALRAAISGTPTSGSFAVWVNSTTIGETGNPAMFEEVQLASGEEDLDTEAEWNNYVGKIATFRRLGSVGQTVAITLPGLQNRPSWVRDGQIIGFKNLDSTFTNQLPGVISVRDSANETIGTVTTKTITKNQTVIFQAPVRPSTSWNVIIEPQAIDVPQIPSVPSQWFYDAGDILAHIGVVRSHKSQYVENGDVRNHITSATFNESPVSLDFANRTQADMVAWVQWWRVRTGESTLNIGSTIDQVLYNLPAALAWITSNIASGYNFDLLDPVGTITVNSIGHVDNNEVRYILSGSVPATYTVNHEVQFQGATNAAHNGTFLITSIDEAANAIHITNPLVSDGTLDEASTSCFAERPLYGTVTSIDTTGLVVGFNVYGQASRSDTVTINPLWFDPDNTGAGSVLAIAYGHSPVTVEGEYQVEDTEGNQHRALGGRRTAASYVDNTGASFQASVELPVTAPDITVRTSGDAVFYLPVKPDDLRRHEARRYTITADALNSATHTNVSVGVTGSVVTFQEGFSVLSLLPGETVTIVVYNDGTRQVVRLEGRVTRSLRYDEQWTGLGRTASGEVETVQLQLAQVPAARNRDPNARVFSISADNVVTINAAGRCEFNVKVQALYNGTNNPDPAQFVNFALVPVVNGSDYLEGESKAALLRSSNAPDNTDPYVTLNSRIVLDANTGDTVKFEVRLTDRPSNPQPGYGFFSYKHLYVGVELTLS